MLLELWHQTSAPFTWVFIWKGRWAHWWDTPAGSPLCLTPVHMPLSKKPQGCCTMCKMGLLGACSPEFCGIMIGHVMEIERSIILVLIPDPLRSSGYIFIWFTWSTDKCYAGMLLLSRKQEVGEEDWEKWLDSRVIRVFSNLNGSLQWNLERLFMY